jgi:hypothetical protein
MRPPRFILAVSYLAFALAGLFFMLWGPNVGIKLLLDTWGFYLWNSFLILGGVIGTFGAWRRKFRIEIIASPFLFSGLVVYGGYILSRVSASPQPGATAGLGTIFVGSGMLFLGKGLAIWIHKIRIADAFERRVDGAE